MSTPTKTLLIIAGVIVVSGGTLAGLELTNTTHIFHSQTSLSKNTKSPLPATTKPTTPDQNQANNPTSQPGQTTPPPSSDQKPPTAAAPSKKLIAPNGTFVNESSGSMNEQMGSTCTTNANVYCQISFTNGTITKSLPKKLTDPTGNVVWSWTPAQVGLTTGTWHMQMTASYNGATKTTNGDPLTFEVKP